MGARGVLRGADAEGAWHRCPGSLFPFPRQGSVWNAPSTLFIGSDPEARKDHMARKRQPEPKGSSLACVVQGAGRRDSGEGVWGALGLWP